MEGGANPKMMARSKRASSRRSRTKHSRHMHGGGPISAPREKTIVEESLPSNWERYGDESGSDTDSPLAAGEVLTKSKGADYRKLLDMDAPKLFEELEEPDGMMAMLLANRSGLWDWETSYLEPTSTNLEHRTIREASALLTLDLRSLEKSIACLNISNRLFVEDEIFPKQNYADYPTEMMDSAASRATIAIASDDGFSHKEDDFLEDRGDNFGDGIVITSLSPMASVDMESSSLNNHVIVKTSSSMTSSILECTSDMKEQSEIEKSRNRNDVKFEAIAAEAELDNLLDMLDNQTTQISLTERCDPSLSMGSPSSSSLATSCSNSSSHNNRGFQELLVNSGPWEATSKSVIETTPCRGSLFDNGVPMEKRLFRNDPKISKVVIPQDDDFDSWLDSI